MKKGGVNWTRLSSVRVLPCWSFVITFTPRKFLEIVSAHFARKVAAEYPYPVIVPPSGS